MTIHPTASSNRRFALCLRGLGAAARRFNDISIRLLITKPEYPMWDRILMPGKAICSVSTQMHSSLYQVEDVPIYSGQACPLYKHPPF